MDKLCELITDTGRAISKRRNIDADSGVWCGDQLKTIADEFAHNMLCSNLPNILPVPVVSEEDPSSQTNQRHKLYWLIDPIDGTRSLSDGYPGWVTQVALVENGTPVMAVIFAPDLDLLYTAKKGQGSFCNYKKLTVNVSNSDRILLIDNFPKPRGLALEVLSGLPCTGYIESGSISLKICRVADGTADLFVKDVPVRDWDIAAPMLILNEAAGTMKTYLGEDYKFSGGFEKIGLIASRSESLQNKCLTFLKHNS